MAKQRKDGKKKFGPFDTSSTVIKKYSKIIDQTEPEDYPELACRLANKGNEFGFFTRLNVEDLHEKVDAILQHLGIVWESESSAEGFVPNRLKDVS